MFRNTFQGGLLTVFFSGGANPLKIWDVRKESGYIQCYLDPDIKAMVMEIGATNVSTTYISSPMGNVVFGITLPFLVMIVKNLKKYFTFEVTILDDTKVRRRFRVANFQSSTKVLPFCTSMPICLADGWNQIQFNLADFTQRAYSRQYMETLKLKINANILLRRIYFADRLVPEDELPAEYKLFFPISSKQKPGKGKQTSKSDQKENLPPSEKQTSTAAIQKVLSSEKPSSPKPSVKSEKASPTQSVKSGQQSVMPGGEEIPSRKMSTIGELQGEGEAITEAHENIGEAAGEHNEEEDVVNAEEADAEVVTNAEEAVPADAGEETEKPPESAEPPVPREPSVPRKSSVPREPSVTRKVSGQREASVARVPTVPKVTTEEMVAAESAEPAPLAGEPEPEPELPPAPEEAPEA